MKPCKDPELAPSESPVWTPTSVQFLYRHRNGKYYVLTFAHGKEKWASLKTNPYPSPRIECASTSTLQKSSG